MAKSKLVKTNEKIAEKVTETYQKLRILWSAATLKSKMLLLTATLPRRGRVLRRQKQG